MRVLRLLAVVLSTVGLTACLNSTTLVKVKPDGSGTVEQTTLMNMAALKGMMGGAQGQMNGPMMNKEELERTAARMGEGVRLLSSEPIKGENGFEGVKAVFSFDDINKIQVSQGPPGMSGGAGNRTRSAEPNSEDPVRFKLTRNGPTSTLTINFIDKAPAGKVDTMPKPNPGDMPDFSNPMIMNMMKAMFQGFKINIGLEVAGSIVKTNAEYVTGPRITLLELDVAELLADEAKFKTLQGKIGPDASLSEVKPYLKDFKGIKIDGPSITVEFR
ncbi:MAG TPA: hypothetical protein VM096_18625 [Vicinamibacterales bacterium]|nr:hypothetical protein [Vicinamibacterales bacterium]